MYLIDVQNNVLYSKNWFLNNLTGFKIFHMVYLQACLSTGHTYKMKYEYRII